MFGMNPEKLLNIFVSSLKPEQKAQVIAHIESAKESAMESVQRLASIENKLDMLMRLVEVVETTAYEIAETAVTIDNTTSATELNMIDLMEATDGT